MKRGAVVLCGGRSTRMGHDKATLPFGPETLLQRVVRRLTGVVREIVVVGRPEQALPDLPPGVRRAKDEVLDRGPLGGLVPGLVAIDADAVFVSGCDVPFLAPALVDLLFDRLGSARVAVPVTGGRDHPLAAVYHRDVLPTLAHLLAEERLRPAYLFDEVPTVRVDERDLRAVDPDLASFTNVNTPDDYTAALARLAESASGPVTPRVRVELYEMARHIAGATAVEMEAATLGDALRETVRRHPELEGPVVADGRPAAQWRANINGERFVDDPETPLHDGDAVLLISALAGG